MQQQIHMIGIGGIGMSALAQLYQSRGAQVTGSDRAASPVTELLSSKGISVNIGHTSARVPETATLVVYSDAVPSSNPERVCALERGIRTLSYFEALGEATREGVSIVVTGTHGKTTTTAMLAQILIDAGKNPTVIAGSILSEYGSNFVAGRPDLFVIEGCEYKRHFLHLHPHILVINNIELDHTDYYRDLSDIQDAFRDVIGRVPEGGTLVTNTSAETIIPVLNGTLVSVAGYQTFSVPPLLAKGEFNRSNAQAAKTAALALDPALAVTRIDASLASFKGTWRRFEYKGTTSSGAVVYDDYAHHPTAIRGTLDMVRAEFPNTRVVVVFHPHLYSRTRDLIEEFASSLALADEVLLAPIYAAREDPIPGITSEVLAERVNALGTSAHALSSLDAIELFLCTSPTVLPAASLLLTMGAGDVYQLAGRLVDRRCA